MRKVRGRHAQRGATLVEAAIIIPVLVLILFAIIDFSWAFYQYISLRQGVREGAREAAITTLPGDSTNWTNCTLATNNLPTINRTTAGQDFRDMICYTKSRIGLGMNGSVRVQIAWSNKSSNPQEPQSWAPTTNPALTDSLVICAQYKISSLTGALSPVLNNYVLTSKTEIRIEQPSTTVGGVALGDILTANPSLDTSGPLGEQAFSSWPASCNAP